MSGQCITNSQVGGFLNHETLSSQQPDLIAVGAMGMTDGLPALDHTVNSTVGYPDLTGTGPEPVNQALPAWELLTGA